jgi:hypothetical protein
MQQQTIQKSAAKPWFHHNQAAHFKISTRDYLNLGKFSNAADKLGLKSTGITKGPFGSGCLLKMSGGAHTYELLLGNGSALLGRVEANGKRVRLFNGPTAAETQWDNLLEALRKDLRSNG